MKSEKADRGVATEDFEHLRFKRLTCPVGINRYPPAPREKPKDQSCSGIGQTKFGSIKLFDSMTFDEVHRVIKHGQIQALEEVIPSVLSPNTTNQFGWTLLMAAALEGNTKIGFFLMEHGADVAALNHFGESALSLAALKGHLPFVKLLKSRGASGVVRPHGHDLESWLRNASGLPQAKIDAIMETV